MEVQQETAPAAAAAEGAGGHLLPAPHGAASVMATVMTDNGEGRSEGDTEMQQQTASGPSRAAACGARPRHSLSRSMAEPAVATAHNTGARSGLTGPPSEQGPVTSNQGQVAHALSSLATVSTGNGEGVGGSVEMSALPSHQAQHATSAPSAFPPVAAALQGAAGEHAAAHATAASAPPDTLVHPAASTPAALPVQPQQPAVAASALPAQPAASVSMSGQGDTPGQQFFGTGVVAMPQSSAAPAARQQHWPALQHGAGGPVHASMQEGQGDRVPMTDARSRTPGEWKHWQ